MNFPSFAVFSAWAFSSGLTLAQGSNPDAGSLRQQIEQSRAGSLPAAVPPAVPAVAAPTAQSGASMTVRSFRFVGNTLLSQAQLAEVLQVYLNRPLGFADLTRAAQAVTDTYREAGWLVRTLIPEQIADDGVVTLQVVEARFGGVRFEGEAPLRVVRAEVEAYILHHQPQGQPLSARAVDRALQIADDLPGAAVAATLAAGPEEGQTSLVMRVTDEPLLSGEVGLDNQGARATGSQRKTASLNINSPGGRGELVSLNLLDTEGSRYARVAFTVPAGYSGLRLGVNASALDYEVVAGPGAESATPIKGKSASLGLEWSAPLVRERMRNLYFTGGLDNKTFLNQDTQVRANYATDSLRVSLAGNSFDDAGGGGASNAFVQVLWGRLGQIKAHPLETRLAGGYRKFSYALSRQQAIRGSHSAFFSLNGQYASELLDSSEKYYVGGANSVRAYPASEVGGERGEVLTAEWRWRLSSAWVLTGFVDRGRAVSLPTNATEAASRTQLAGRGLSLAWQGPLGLNARLTWARRIGENPKPTEQGTDSDGTLKRDRLWMTATLPF